MVRLVAVLVAAALGQIRVMSPRAARERFKESDYMIRGSTATFGAPYYGETIIGRLQYGHYEGTSTSPHCDATKYSLASSEPLGGTDPEEPTEMVNIVVVERGGCSFVKKVLEAQKQYKPHAVIVVDRPRPGEVAHTSETIQSIIMGDDGNGWEVRIPSVLISQADGDFLIQQIEQASKDVIVELQWEMNESTEIEVDFWLSSGSREAVEFLTEFRPHAEAIHRESTSTRKYLDFIPHYYIFSMPDNVNQMCFEHEHKFCSADPDGTGFVTGRDVVEEDLRQICLWHRTAEEEDPEADKEFETFSVHWWDYIKNFHDNCFNRDATDKKKQFGKECSDVVMDKIKVSDPMKRKITKCVSNEADERLSHELQTTAWGPLALRINGWRYRGVLEAETVLRAICATYVQRVRPKACGDILAHFGGSKVDKVYRSEGLSFKTAGLVLLSMIGAIIVILWLYGRYLNRSVRSALREEVMLEVKAAVMQRGDAYQSM